MSFVTRVGDLGCGVGYYKQTEPLLPRLAQALSKQLIINPFLTALHIEKPSEISQGVCSDRS